MVVPHSMKGDEESPKTKDISLHGNSLIVPRRASEGVHTHDEPLPQWAWYSQPIKDDRKSSLTAPLTAPNTPTSFPLDSSFHEAIRQRLFNSRCSF